jgi:hypothetical protein
MKEKVIDRLSTLIIGAFGLIAALAWNEAIKALFVGPCDSEKAGALCMISSGGPWAYAIIVTIIAVVAAIWIGKIAEKSKKPIFIKKKIKAK